MQENMHENEFGNTSSSRTVFVVVVCLDSRGPDVRSLRAALRQL